MKLTKKLISVFVSLIMVVSALPFSAISAQAASYSLTENSVVAFGDYYLYDYFGSPYYFDSVQSAVNYMVSNQTKSSIKDYWFTLTLLKDVELTQPVTINGLNRETLFIETNGHNISCDSGSAFKITNSKLDTIYLDYCQSAYYDNLTDDHTSGYGSIIAKDYAIETENVTDYSQGYTTLMVYGGTFETSTKDNAFDDSEVYPYILCADIIGDTVKYNNNGYFGDAQNTQIYFTDESDPFYLKHVVSTTIDGKSAYCVANHNYQYPVVSTDDGTVIISDHCKSCGYESGNVYNAVAMIGDDYYPTIPKAFAAVPYGGSGEIKLIDDITFTKSMNFPANRDVILDLNNHTITQSVGYMILNDTSLTVKNGTLFTDSTEYLFILKGSENKDATDYTNLKLVNTKLYSVKNYGTAILIDNPYWAWRNPYRGYGINLDIDKCYIKGDNCGLSVNGNFDNKYPTNCIHININESDFDCVDMGMYIAGYCEVNSTATNYSGYAAGAEIRAGILNVLGDENTFTSTYEGNVELQPNPSGSTTTGAALAIVQHNLSPVPNPVEVNIYGGTYNGPIALNEAMVEDIAPEHIDVTLNIYGGEYNGTEESVHSDTCTEFISGGKYSIDPAEELIVPEKQTRLEADGMYVLTNLDYTAYRAAVKAANSIDRSIYTDASLSSLDATILPEYALNTQDEVNSATADIETKLAELQYKTYDVAFSVENTTTGDVTTQTYQYKYGEIATIDASDVEGDVYKWTIADSTTKILPTDKKTVSFVVRGATDVNLYVKDCKSESSALTKITYVSNKNVTVAIDYVENKDNITSTPDAPDIPFYNFVRWDRVDDTTYKAVYTYDSGYCRFIGGTDVVINNRGNSSTDFDSGIDVPYDEEITIDKNAEGQLALSADPDGLQIITYINDVNMIHAPKRETVYVIILPQIDDATVGVTGGYVKHVADKKKVAINGQYYLPVGCTMVDTGVVFCNKDSDFKIGDAGAIKLVSTMQSTSNEFTVAMTSNLGAMTTLYARTYLTYTDSNGTIKTIYSKIKTVDLTTEHNLG